MCLIAIKPAGEPMPSDKELKQWFNTHPDGFGIAFPFEGRVRVLKGALSKRAMLKLVKRAVRLSESITDKNVMFQFRTAVTGGACERFCHPFPISIYQKDLDSLDVVANSALAHNGVIWDYSDYAWEHGVDINDAQEFIKDYAVPLGDNIFNPAVKDLIIKWTESVFAILKPDRVEYIGKFIEDGGLLFSNMSYLGKQYGTISYMSQSDVYGTGTYYKPKRKKNGISIHKIENMIEAQDKTKLLPQHFDGGTLCELCGEYHPVVYEGQDDGAVTCFLCFTQLHGREPDESEIYV